MPKKEKKAPKASKVQQFRPGYTFILVLAADGAQKKSNHERHGDARRAAHRHLLANPENEAAIITIFTPHTMIVNPSGSLSMVLGEPVMKGIQNVSRSDAELERFQEIDAKLRDTTVYAEKKPSPATGMHGPADKPRQGRSWQRAGSQYNAWDKSRKPQGLPLQKS